MKKLISILTICCMIAAVTTGCSTKTVTEEQPSQTTMIGNPWSDWSSIEEAESVIEFTFGLPDVIAESYQAETIRTLKNELIEVVYYSGDVEVCIRKQKGEGQDISGDYNHYETCTETSTEDGAILTEYDNSSNNAIKLLISYNGYSWSFVAQGGDIEDFKSDIVNQILNQK